jgi:hypothetical protein
MAACGGGGAAGGGDGDGDDDGTLDRTPPVTTASPASDRIHQGSIGVTLSTDEPAVTHYTLDGSEPGPSSAVYATPIVVDRSRTLRFYSIDPAGNAETSREARYRIDVVRHLLLEVGAN